MAAACSCVKMNSPTDDSHWWVTSRLVKHAAKQQLNRSIQQWVKWNSNNTPTSKQWVHFLIQSWWLPAPVSCRHWLARQQTALVREALLLQDGISGTPYQLICDRWPAIDSVGDIWQHIYLGLDTTAHCDFWIFALYRYTYLLTLTLSYNQLCTEIMSGVTKY